MGGGQAVFPWSRHFFGGTQAEARSVEVPTKPNWNSTFLFISHTSTKTPDCYFDPKRLILVNMLFSPWFSLNTTCLLELRPGKSGLLTHTSSSLATHVDPLKRRGTCRFNLTHSGISSLCNMSVRYNLPVIQDLTKKQFPIGSKLSWWLRGKSKVWAERD